MSLARAILWDFDGTLAMREGLWSQAIADTLARHHPSLEVVREAIAPHLSSGFFWHTPEVAHTHIVETEPWWEALYPVLERAISLSSGLSALEARRLLPEVRAEYLRPAAWNVYPDVVPCLEQLRKLGWRHMILSNHVPELEELVVALGLREHFSAVFTSAKTGYEKPHPGAFQAALQTLAPGTETWMIGDSYPADVVGAEQAGLRAVLVRKPHPLATRYEPDLMGLLRLLHE